MTAFTNLPCDPPFPSVSSQMIAQEAEATDAKQPEAIGRLPNAAKQNPAWCVGTNMTQESQFPQLTHCWL